MQTLYFIAGVIAVLTGIVHSVLGEHLIFRHVRDGSLVPTLGAPPLRERHIRIIWATWHLVSIFAWASAGVLIRLAFSPAPPASIVAVGIASAYLGGAILVLVSTKGRHPGWVALLAVASLTWVGASAG
ncbi:MAG: hypothetical protein H7315_03390 [Herminiimonas sp.]|nr:hypothetical protein [Herminiimonas sp.]